MKKALILLTLSSVTIATFGQGYVDWSAPSVDMITTTNSINYSSYAALGGGAATGQAGASQGDAAGAAGNIYYYELMWAPGGTTLSTTSLSTFNNWTATGLLGEVNTLGNNGRVLVDSPMNAYEIDPAWSSGVLQVALVGWSANLGTTFGGTGGVLSELNNWDSDEIANAYFGVSYVGTVTPNTSTTLGAIMWSSSQTAGGLISNPAASPMVMSELEFVPEPGTMALAAMGAASLLAFRRRK